MNEFVGGAHVVVGHYQSHPGDAIGRMGLTNGVDERGSGIGSI